MADWDRRAYGGGHYRERQEDSSVVHSRFRRKVVTVTLILLALIFTGGFILAIMLLFPDYKPVAPASENAVIEFSDTHG